MTPDQTLCLSARFCAECEADIRYALAEGLDPHHEYLQLVAQLQDSSMHSGTRSISSFQPTRVDLPEVDSTMPAQRHTFDHELQDFERAVAFRNNL